MHSPTDLIVLVVVLIPPLLAEHAVEEIVATPEMHTDKSKRCGIYSACAIMTDQLDTKLDTSRTWSFQEFDLRLYEQIESHFRHRGLVGDPSNCGSLSFSPNFSDVIFLQLALRQCSGVDSEQIWVMTVPSGKPGDEHVLHKAQHDASFPLYEDLPLIKKSICTNVRKPRRFRLLFHKSTSLTNRINLFNTQCIAYLVLV